MQKENETISLENLNAPGTREPGKEWAMEGFSMGSTGAYAPVRLTSLGMEFVQDLTLEQLKELVVAFKGMDTFCALNLADLLNYGAQKFGEEQMELLLESVEFDYSQARKAVSLMQVPRSLRNPELNKEHYFVVSTLEYGEQLRWLNEAVLHDLSPLELKRSIEAGRVLTKDEIVTLSGSGSGVFTYQGVITGFERWSRKVGGVEKIMSWSRDQKERWLSDMKVVLDLAEQVRDSLEEVTYRKV